MEKYYSRIRLDRLAKFLDFCEENKERKLAAMVSDNKALWTRIDKPAKTVSFAKPKEADSLLNSWASDVSSISYSTFLCVAPSSSPNHVFVMVENVLISISEEGKVVVWTLPENTNDRPFIDGIVLSEIHISPDFAVTYICHPQTYINKILLGAKDGRCLLVNFRAMNVVHMFPWFESAITITEPSPVVDVFAVGTADGSNVLHNLRIDEAFVTFWHMSNALYPEQGEIDLNPSNAVNVISFRTDFDERIMTGDADGNMFIWN
eukprot:gb/GEZJ01004255.1/.p1 GENE.gb/GEZJ01004255.1/~~gb/GEZJ01004255.1/.p1  ORF type:complete len:263 (+),score=45.41 gb/GEZJ01004255.1/:1573-2361(+)